MTAMDNSGDAAGGTPADLDLQPITVTVNGERARTRARTLYQLVIERQLGEAKIATALNGDFIPAGARAQTNLQDGDAIEIVAPRQGG